MLDCAPVAAYWTREDGTFAWVNKAACDMLDYSRQQLLALTIFDVDEGLTREFWQQHWHDAASRESSSLERLHRRRDGSLIPVDVQVRHLSQDGRPLHFSFVRDLTSQKQSEKLQESRAQYMTTLFVDSPMPQLLVDPEDLRIVDCNRAATAFYGYPDLRQLRGTDLNTLPEDQVRAEAEKACRGGRYFFRFRHRLASGDVRDVHVYTGLIDADGRTLLHSSIEDVTAIYAFQRELATYRDRLARLPIGIYSSSPGPDGVILDANQALCDILEADSRDDLIGRRPASFYRHANGRNAFSERVMAAGQVQRLERQLVTLKGRHIDVSLTVRATAQTDGSIVFEGAMQDISDRRRAEREREAAFERLDKALHAAPIPIMLHRADGGIEDVNDAWCRLTGYTREDLQAVADWTALLFGERAPAIRGHISRLKSQRQGADEGDYRIQCKDGSTRVWDFHSAPLEPEERPDCLLISTAIDVTEEREKQHLARQAQAILLNATEGMVITDPERRIEYVNPSFSRITGYTLDEVVGRNPSMLSSGKQDAQFYERLWETIEQTGHWQGEIWNRRKSGELYPEWQSISAIHDDRGRLVNYAGVFTDLTELKRFQSTLRRLQRFDPLTGLPNKQTLLGLIDNAIYAAGDQERRLALMVCGLDRFHMINETFGHQVGDRILQQLAERLKGIAGDDMEVARLGGDHFALLLYDRIDEDHLGDILLRLRGITAQPVSVEGAAPINLQFSTGVARYPTDAGSATDLLRDAETAMFQAKRDSRGLYAFFDGKATETAQQRLLLEIDLRRAIDADALDVYFQPVVSVRDNRIVGAEGLARWQHTELGLVSPEVFIPIAEEAGLINAITERLLRKAADVLRQLSGQFAQPLRLAFNISASQFDHAQFVDWILGCLEQASFPPSLFELEITESTLMQRGDAVRNSLARLRDYGVSVSIDDFGTGFSSLAYLQEIQAQTLKIDRRFIADIPGRGAGKQIVRSVVAMAHALDMALIAEGVEEPAQRDFLEGLGCEYYQGYLFSQPLSAEAFAELLAGQARGAQSPK
jgi:diguanylate cyclase (GGDEF)-like protein/PAS domain S-box-containing protein